MRGLSLVAAIGGHSSSRCAGLSLLRPFLLWSTGSRRAGSVVVAHGPSRSSACGIFPDQGSNPCPSHWRADSPGRFSTTAPPGKPRLYTFLNGFSFSLSIFIIIFLVLISLFLPLYSEQPFKICLSLFFGFSSNNKYTWSISNINFS